MVRFALFVIFVPNRFFFWGGGDMGKGNVKFKKRQSRKIYSYQHVIESNLFCRPTVGCRAGDVTASVAGYVPHISTTLNFILVISFNHSTGGYSVRTNTT
jgi:hypothetical protein